MVPGIMMQEPVPDAFAASCAIPHGMQPHEVGMKF
jgi:predicted acylesterase/phospholipase RssA